VFSLFFSVLGNEGHGMRTNIKNRCTHLVRIGAVGGREASVLSPSPTPPLPSGSGTDTKSVVSGVADSVDEVSEDVSSVGGSDEGSEEGSGVKVFASEVNNKVNEEVNEVVHADSGVVDSLNVSVTGGILLHHIMTALSVNAAADVGGK
jgi:hypothetical protein